jgi:hypothetical protein
MSKAYSPLQIICAGVLIATLASCAAVPMPSPARQSFAIHETDLTCDQANRISYRVLEQLGYEVRAFTPASAGGKGVVRGARARPIGEDWASAWISCGGDGIHVTADGSGGLMAMNVQFSQSFYSRFKGHVEAARRGEEPKAQGQMQIVMEPLIGLKAKLEFGTEVTGIFPVRVEVSNTTNRTYVLDAEQMMLRTSSGDRVKPLSEGNGTFPARALTSQTVAPGTNIKAYLYYPPGSYTGARGSIVEKESQEREGFDVQF